MRGKGVMTAPFHSPYNITASLVLAMPWHCGSSMRGKGDVSTNPLAHQHYS
jgi:hypothetical protein